MAENQSTGREPLSKVEMGKRVGKEFSNDDVPGLAAEVAYHLIFAIPPIIILLVLIAAVLEDFTSIEVVRRLSELVDERAPADLQPILENLIENAVDQVSGGFAIFGIISTVVVALWSGSNGTASLMKAFNRAYGTEDDRPYIRKRVTAIGLTLLMGLLINVAFVLFVFGQRIGEWAAEQLGYGSAFETTVNIARWPLGLLFLIGMLAVLYYVAPNVEQSFRWISPGSIVAAILWVAAVYGFSIYLQFSDPGSAYGVLGSLLVFLLFLYLTAIILLIGAEINAVVDKQYDPETVEDLSRQESRPPYEAGSLPASTPPGPAERYPEATPAYATQGSMASREDLATWKTVAFGLAAAAGAVLLGRLGRRN